MLYTYQKKFHQEDNTILNIYALNRRVPKFIKETLLQIKSHTDPQTVILGDLST